MNNIRGYIFDLIGVSLITLTSAIILSVDSLIEIASISSIVCICWMMFKLILKD